MTTMCLSDETLLAVQTGDGAPDDVRHAGGCVLCARRLTHLRADLARIDAILALPPPPPVRLDHAGGFQLPTPRWLAPLAAAAMVALVVATRMSLPTTPAASDADVAAVLADVNAVFATSDDDSRTDDTPGAIDVAFGARSTCRLDEPFIGIDCNDEGVTLAALSQ